MGWKFDASLSTDKDWVRFLIGDTNTRRQYVQDETIIAVLGTEANIYMAAARIAESLYRQLTAGGALEDRKVGETRIRYQAAHRFLQMSKELKMRGSTYQLPWAGGIYQSDVDAYNASTNKRKLDIAQGMTDNPRAGGTAD